MVTTEVKMASKLTTNFIICPVCKISNQFVIQVVEQNGDYYYGEKCPRERCGHFEDFKLINGRTAKLYIDIPSPDPFE